MKCTTNPFHGSHLFNRWKGWDGKRSRTKWSAWKCVWCKARKRRTRKV